MVNLSNFYNTLLSIEIAVFSIIVAAIFVFLQLVYTNFSYRQVKFIFRNPYLLSYFIVSWIDLFITAAGSFCLAVNKTNPVVTNLIFVLLCLILMVFSIALFFVLIFKNLGYLEPSKILLLLGQNIKYEPIRNFLFKKYEIKNPAEEREIRTIFNIEETSEEDDRKLKIDLERYNRLKEVVKSATDPLEPINEITIQSINKADLKTLNESMELICEISKKFVSKIPQIDEKNEWNPDSALSNHYADYLVEMMHAQIEMCERQKLESLKLKVLDTSKIIVNYFIESNHFTALLTMFNFWKKIADNAIGISSQIFRRIIGYYKEIGEIVFEKQKKEVLDEVFRDVGWLGERLLTKKRFEEKPLMFDRDYYTEYDELMECLLHFGYEYRDKHPELYPLIYFDAIDVVFLKLVQIFLNDKKNTEIKESLFDCVSVYYSFGEKAIIAGNSDGAALASMNLKKSYEKLKENNLIDEAKYTIGLLVRIGIVAAAYKDKLAKARFLHKELSEWIIEVVEKSEFKDTITHEVFEGYLNFIDMGSHDNLWKFITELGKRMKTNFGLRFDWKTGEKYPEDDS